MTAAKTAAVILLCCGALFMLGFLAAHIAFTVFLAPLLGAAPAAIPQAIPAYVAALSYAVALVLGLVQAFSNSISPRCAAISNISVDVAFLLTAGASAIISISLVAGFAVARVLIPGLIGPPAAELALIVIAIGLYVAYMCFRASFLEIRTREESVEMKSY